MSSPAELYERLHDAMASVIVGNDEVIEGLTIALLTDGHLLLEGVPGVAKTSIARAFSQAVGLSYSRIQMTPDMVPADITGTNVYRQQTGEFERRRGPVFANMVVADEINRATPKTQSALLEAMEESTVTIDGTTLQLPRPFMVVATQNPIEMEGVFELPEAQRDRFRFKYTVELPERPVERTVLDEFDASPPIDVESVEQAISMEAVQRARNTVDDVFIADNVKEYILDLVTATREAAALQHGSSPRASIAFLVGAKARAAIRGRAYVIPDDIKILAAPVLVHRVIRTTEAELSGQTRAEIVSDLVASVPTPSGELTATAAETVEDNT